MEPPKTSIRDLKVIQGKFPRVLVRQHLKDTLLELPTAIEAIETDQEYYDTQKAQAEQRVDYWLKRVNYLNTISLVFALVANFVLLMLIIAFIVGYRFQKKLATLIVTLAQTKPLKALEIEGFYTTKAPTLSIQPEDDTVIIKNVAWILISATILVLVGMILKKIYRLHCYKSSVVRIFWPCCM